MVIGVSRHDPIRDGYYKPLEIAEGALNFLFFVTALLSFAVLLLDKNSYSVLYEIIENLFVIAVTAVFSLGIGVRLYWTPKAEDQRRLDLLSNSYSLPLTHEQTAGYYNNDETAPIKRLGLSVMENSFFSKAITLEMAKIERIKIVLYAIIFFITILYRSTDLAIITTAAQVVFSEQIVARFFRLEWLRARCDATYQGLYNLFQNKPKQSIFNAKILEYFSFYESSKSNAGILLSEKIFKKLNYRLSGEWSAIKSLLGL